MQTENNDNNIITWRQVRHIVKKRFFALLLNTIFNFHSIEALVLLLLAINFPQHARDINFFAATYLGLKGGINR